MSLDDQQSEVGDKAVRLEPKVVLQARDLDERLRDAYCDGHGDKEGLREDVPVCGQRLVVALKGLAATLTKPTSADSDVLLARFGNDPGENDLALLGRELGVNFSTNHTSPKKINRVKAPFVCLLEDQTAIVVLGKNATGHWIYLGASGKAAISDEKLARIVSGVWIGVERAETQFASEANGAGSGQNTSDAYLLLVRFASVVFKGSKAKLLQLLVAAGLSNLILIALPLFITIVYDRVIPHGAFETLAALCIGLVLIFGIDIGLRTTRINLQEAIGVGAGQQLQTRFYRKMLYMPLIHSSKSSTGISALLGEIDHVALSMPALFAGLLADLPFVILMLALVGFLSGPVVYVPIIGIFLIAIVNIVGSMRARRSAGQAHRLRLKLQDETVAASMMLPTVKAACAEQQFLNRWENGADETAYEMSCARQAATVSAQIALVITQLIVAFTIVVGAVQINSGVMTLGNLAASVLLVGRILAPVSQVVSQVGQLGNMGGALKTFFGVVDLEDENGGEETGLAGGQFKGAIELRNVSFIHKGAAATSLDNLSISIKEGERVGIIGRNGCGKSTLLKLIPRFFDPDEGVFLLDGHDARQLTPQYLRRFIGLMSQDTILMHDSLRANICLGMDKVDPDDFKRAVQVSGVEDLARHHPKGYSLDVGVRGEALSGGERQQVGLARAILRNPSLLILDEPSSAMDNSTEARLINALPTFLEGRTLILATHRTQMLALVDRVILMESGKIIADGPKQQVLASLLKTG